METSVAVNIIIIIYFLSLTSQNALSSFQTTAQICTGNIGVFWRLGLNKLEFIEENNCQL